MSGKHQSESEIGQLSLFFPLVPVPQSPLELQSVFSQEGPRSRLDLRDYQRRMKRGIYQEIRSGNQRLLVYGPTGCGKTLVLSSILQDAIAKGRRSMLLVHRDFLVEQTIKTLLDLGVSGDAIGIIKAGYSEDRSKPLQICGIQSLMRRPMLDNIGLVIVDECHSCAFWTEYERVKQSTPGAIHLGFSASPWRLKSSIEYFGLHFESIVLGPSIKQLIREGYLAQPRYFGYGGVDLTQLDTGSDGDFKTAQMGKIFVDSNIPEQVVERVSELCEGRTGIIFNASVEQSRLQTQLLNAAGIPASHIDANTSINERREIYRQLESGKIRIISSIGCLTEGFDVKSISFIVLARATKSRALYVQICGRGIRSFPGKVDCLILDFGGNVNRHGFLTKDWKITLEPTPPPPEMTMTKNCPECNAVISIFARICPECGYEFPPGEGDNDDDSFDLDFGEMFDEESFAKVKYARSQRKARFTKNQPPHKLWETFKVKFGDELLICDWLFGSIFGGCDNEYNRQRLLHYLDEFAPFDLKKKPGWIKYHIELEFGRPGRQYKTGKGRTQSAQIGSLQKLDWWQILGVCASADWQTVKQAYRSLARQYHPDTSELPENEATQAMKLLNLGFDRAKEDRDRGIFEAKASNQRSQIIEVGALVVSLDEPHLGVGTITRHDPNDRLYEWEVFFEMANRWLPTSALTLTSK